MKFLLEHNIHLIIAIVLSAVNGAMLCFAGTKLLHIIQLSGYKISGYRDWLKDTKVKYIARLATLSFLSALCVLATNAFLDGYGEYYSYVGLIFYFYLTIVFIINMFNVPQKTPLKQTKRMNRLMCVVFVMTSAVTFVLIGLCFEYISYVRFAVVTIMPILLPVIVPLAHFIMVPLEAIIRLHYIVKAKRKLKKYNNLIKIGITGSYGKTTTKHILNIMLSKKYNVCMSPHSFNTPMGLTKVILKYLKPEHNILIAEMGARHVGDIQYLCRLINPQHAIITAVGTQHLATFGSEENISKAKNELVNAISEGYVAFNAENLGAMKLYNQCDKQKLLCGINNAQAFVNITNVKANNKGSVFNLTINNKSVECQTKLLGKHNLEDIAVSAGIAYKLGISLGKIKAAMQSLNPLPHRLELIEENGLIILDNSFNSSIESSRCALETLALFEGNKVVVTPGLVELGGKEYQANENLGTNIASVANKVIIVNKVNSEAIKTGLLSCGFNSENIYFAESLNEAKKMLASVVSVGDVILFENDLPDNYT